MAEIPTKDKVKGRRVWFLMEAVNDQTGAVG